MDSSCECDGFDADTAALNSYITIQPTTATNGQFVTAWVTTFDYNNLKSVTWGSSSGKLGIARGTLMDSCFGNVSRLGVAKGVATCLFVYSRDNNLHQDEKWDLSAYFTDTWSK